MEEKDIGARLDAIEQRLEDIEESLDSVRELLRESQPSASIYETGMGYPYEESYSEWGED